MIRFSLLRIFHVYLTTFEGNFIFLVGDTHGNYGVTTIMKHHYNSKNINRKIDFSFVKAQIFHVNLTISEEGERERGYDAYP